MNAATGLLLWAIPNKKAETNMAANTIIWGGRTASAEAPHESDLNLNRGRQPLEPHSYGH